MPNPTPSPASGAGLDELCVFQLPTGDYHYPVAICGKVMPCADHPTPPSDAGTSERETGLSQLRTAVDAAGDAVLRSPLANTDPAFQALVGAFVAARAAYHNARRGEVLKESCPKCSGSGGAGYETAVACPWCGGAGTVPAAPAAEGPRPEVMLCSRCQRLATRSVDGVCARCFNSPPAAALPGAEAGTPDLAALERIARANGYWNYIAPFADRLAALTSEVAREGKMREQAVEAQIAYYRRAEKAEAEVARLTSEVRALTEQRDALEAELCTCGAGSRGTLPHLSWCAFFKLAARLASPSPTGAP